MKIAYFDLGFSKEEYGLRPTKYGGGAVAARYLKEDPDIDFQIFAPAESFANVSRSEKGGSKCFVIPEHVAKAFRSGLPISEVDGFDVNSFDIVMHPHTCETLQRGSYRGPIVHFCGFGGDAGHPGNDYILFYDRSFSPMFGEKPKYVTIGKPVPKHFIPSPRADFVFQCSRHDSFMNSIEIAKECLRFKIPAYFAGPIRDGYNLLEYIDNRTTFYLGEIDEDVKLGYYRHARMFTLLPTWNVPFNQSVIEAQGQGTPIFVRPRGPFFSKYLRHGINGFSSEKCSFLEAFELSRDLSQAACWQSALPYDVSRMVESFKAAFREICAETKKT